LIGIKGEIYHIGVHYSVICGKSFSMKKKLLM